MSLRHATLVIVGSTVGAGIFVTPGLVAKLAGSPGAALAAWAFGGVLALCGGLAYTELASRHPQGGGDYIYLRQAYGPLAGFLDGWIVLGVVFPGSIAALALALSNALASASTVIPSDALLWGLNLGPFFLDFSVQEAVALLALAMLTLANLGSVRSGLRTSDALNGVKLLLLLGVAIWLLGGAPERRAVPSSDWSWSLFGAALVPVFFAWTGWNAATYITGELEHPERVLPRALVLSLILIGTTYLLANWGLFQVLGFGGVASRVDVFGPAAARVYGSHWARLFASGLQVLVLAGTIHAMILTGARLVEAMAGDGWLPQAWARAAPASGEALLEQRSPRAAVLALSAWSAVLVLSGSVERLVEFATAGVLLLSAATVVAVPVQRKRLGPAPYSLPAAAVLLPTYFLGCAWALWGVFRYDGTGVGWGLVMACVGLLPGWMLHRRRLRRTPPA